MKNKIALPSSQPEWDTWTKVGIFFFTDIDVEHNPDTIFQGTNYPIGNSRSNTWTRDFFEFYLFSPDQIKTKIGRGIIYTLKETLPDINQYWAATLICLELLDDLKITSISIILKKLLTSLREQDKNIEKFKKILICAAAKSACEKSISHSSQLRKIGRDFEIILQQTSNKISAASKKSTPGDAKIRPPIDLWANYYGRPRANRTINQKTNITLPQYAS